MDTRVVHRSWGWAGFGLLAVVLSWACEWTESREVGATAGALGLQCNPGGVEVGEVRYSITHSGVKNYRSGSIKLLDAEKQFSTVIGPLPAGDDYAITLQATALRPKSGESSECSGVGSFIVTPRQTTIVAITLRCGGVRMSDTNANHCPRIDNVRAIPSEVDVGDTIWLSGDAHDEDHPIKPLAFDWHARDGMLTGPRQSKCGFVCTRTGRPGITLKVTDGDDTCAEESVTIFVTCRLSRGNAGAAGNALGGGAAGASNSHAFGAAGAKAP